MQKWMVYLLVFMFTTPVLMGSSCEIIPGGSQEGGGGGGGGGACANTGKVGTIVFSKINSTEVQYLKNLTQWVDKGVTFNNKDYKSLVFKYRDGNHADLGITKTDNEAYLLSNYRNYNIAKINNGVILKGVIPIKYSQNPTDLSVEINAIKMNESTDADTIAAWMFFEHEEYIYFAHEYNAQNGEKRYNAIFAVKKSLVESPPLATDKLDDLKIKLVDPTYEFPKDFITTLKTNDFVDVPRKEQYSIIFTGDKEISLVGKYDQEGAITKVFGFQHPGPHAGAFNEIAITRTFEIPGKVAVRFEITPNREEAVGTAMIGFGQNAADANTNKLDYKNEINKYFGTFKFIAQDGARVDVNMYTISLAGANQTDMLRYQVFASTAGTITAPGKIFLIDKLYTREGLIHMEIEELVNNDGTLNGFVEATLVNP